MSAKTWGTLVVMVPHLAFGGVAHTFLISHNTGCAMLVAQVLWKHELREKFSQVR